MPSTIHAEPYREAVLSTYVGTTFNACGTEWQVQAIDEMRPADSFTTIVRFSFCDTRYGEHVYTAINLDEVFETGEMVNVSPVIHYGIDRFITELPRFKVNKWKQKYDKVVI